MSFTKSALAVATILIASVTPCLAEKSDGAMQTYNRLLAKYITASGGKIFGMEEQRRRCASAPKRGGRDRDRKDIRL